jgi:phosphate transport system permease protein
MSTHTSPGPRRTRLAVAGARSAVAPLSGAKESGRAANSLFRAALLLGLGLALLGLFSILIWTLVTGGPRVNAGLFFNNPSTIDPSAAGFRTSILGTLYVIGGVILLIVPLGVGTAVYLEEFADPTRWYNRLIDLNIQNLAGVPSIVFGILGLGFIVRGPLSLGFVAAAGSLTLALLVLPTIIIASREAIRAVPSSVRDGSLALGATLLQTVRQQIIPAARPGILTGIILSVARAIGEAAPLLLVGAVTFVTFDPRFFSGGYSTLPVQIFQYFKRPQEEFQLLAAGGAIVMVIIVLVMNSFAVWLRNHYEKQLAG